MTSEPQAARVVERYVVEKFDGDPPTAACPKDPVEVVTIERRSDGTVQRTVDPPKE